MHEPVDRNLAAPESAEEADPCKCTCVCLTESLNGEEAGNESSLVSTLGSVAASTQLNPHGGGRPSQ